MANRATGYSEHTMPPTFTDGRLAYVAGFDLFLTKEEVKARMDRSISYGMVFSVRR